MGSKTIEGLKGYESFFYILGCICSLGALWLLRLAITKAVYEGKK